MKENKINTANVNYNIWKDKFLPEGQEPSDDYLPPEVKTYCQVVDGISKDNGLNILVVPICAPEDNEYTEQNGIKQSLGGTNNSRERDNMIDLIEERKENDYYKLVNEKYKELCNQNKPFGMLYVYHNKYCIKHVQPLVYLNKDNAYQADCNANIDLSFPIAGSGDSNDSKKYHCFYFEEKNFHKDFFSCRIFAIQFLLSLYKHKNDILKLDEKFLYYGSWRFFCLPEDFIKYAQVNIELLAGLLCIFDKIRSSQNCQKELLDGLDDASFYLRAYSNNSALQDWLSKKITQFKISEEEIKQKTDMLKNDVYREKNKGKWCNVGLAKLGAEWYAKYADKKFLEEHNDIIKKYNREHNIEYYNDIEESDAYFHENFDIDRYGDPKNQYQPDRHGALATIDETYNKIMEQKKNGKNQQSTQNNNTNSNGKANNEDDKSSMIMKNDNNDKESGEGSRRISIKEEDGMKNGTVNSSKDGENITFSCPFFNCFSCNGCAVFNQKIEQANEQTFTK